MIPAEPEGNQTKHTNKNVIVPGKRKGGGEVLHTFCGMDQSHTLTTVQSVLGARASCLSSFHMELQTIVVVWNPDVYSRSKRPKRFHDPGLMTHSVAPLCVPGRPRPHGQGQLSQHRITEVSTSLEPRSADSGMSEVSQSLMTASRTSVIHSFFPGGDAGPHGPAPLSPRELLLWSRAK